ncbi:MAG: LacI family DNA-binding transcriptional regulator [Opitutae bacterium]|nr:LacI family DNA-binding transcriptional regulator [Opitutae bacterium]
MRFVSQQLIAKKLKISSGTVSRSLANDPAISGETRSRVLQVAEEMGYNFTRPRRKKTSTRPLTVGVLVGVRDTAPGTATFPFILKGIHDRAAQENVAIDVRFPNPDEFTIGTKRNEVFRQVRSGGWRGVILIYPFSDDAVAALARKTTAVAVLEDYVDLGVDSIDTDQTAGIERIVDELVRAGHRRIGFAAWHYPVGGHWTKRRFSAYLEGVYDHGLPLNPDWTINVRKDVPKISPPEMADRIAHLVRTEGVTAWVCAADHQAYPLIHDLHVRGLRVPEDCSISGYDGITPPVGMPQVASIRVPHEEVGSSALGRLLYRMPRPHALSAKLLLRSEFVVGKTIAPPPVSVAR